MKDVVFEAPKTVTLQFPAAVHGLLSRDKDKLNLTWEQYIIHLYNAKRRAR